MSTNTINELKTKRKCKKKNKEQQKKNSKKSKNEWPREKQKALFSFFRFHS